MPPKSIINAGILNISLQMIMCNPTPTLCKTQLPFWNQNIIIHFSHPVISHSM